MPKPESVRSRSIHHIAFATRDPEATYEFYARKLGMTLLHTENHRQGDGYFRHFFFDMGGGEALAFFEVHGVGEKADFRTDISRGLGLPREPKSQCLVGVEVPDDQFGHPGRQQGPAALGQTYVEDVEGPLLHDPLGRPPVRREGDRPEIRREGDRPQIRREGDRPEIRREGDRPAVRREGERDRPPLIRRERERDGRPREGDRDKPRGEGDEG